MPTTEIPPTVASLPIKWWIIPAVICPVLLFIIIVGLIWCRWKKGAPTSKVDPHRVEMLEKDKRRVRIFAYSQVTAYSQMNPKKRSAGLRFKTSFSLSCSFSGRIPGVEILFSLMVNTRLFSETNTYTHYLFMLNPSFNVSRPKV